MNPLWRTNFAFVAGVAYGREDCLSVLKQGGWRLLLKHSRSKAVVLLKGNCLAVGFRGTVLTDAEDLADDAALIAGDEDDRPRFRHAVALVRSLRKAYPHCRLILVGHSLGGSLCLATCYKVPGVVEAHGYNAFASPTMIIRSKATVVNPIANYRHVVLHCVLEDPVAADTLLMGQVKTDFRAARPMMDPHSLENFW